MKEEQFNSFLHWYEYGFSGVTEQAAAMEDRAAAIDFITKEVTTFVICDPNYKRETKSAPEEAHARFIVNFSLYLCGRTDEQREQTKKTKQI